MSVVNITPEDYKILEVRKPNNAGMVHAMVSSRDYIDLAGMPWRLCASGYPMYVKRVGGKSTTIWMHKLVHGGPATHINGNRLDCRRENLVDSYRKNQFEIKTPDAVYDRIEEFQGGDRDLRFYSGFAHIHYEKGKFYSGQVVYGIPHGFGHLYEPANCKHSSGEWLEGKMTKGMVVEYEFLPECMCNVFAGCPTRRVRHIQLIGK
jgi:hypothetical protein